MSDLPVLWLCGASGAGKSATAWSLFERVGAAHAVGFVDIDQLGMLYPEPEDDPDRYALKAEALAALVPHYAAAGARALVVSGILDPTSAPDLPGLRVTYALLDPGEAELRRRILERGWDPADADEAVAESTHLRSARFVDHVVDTSGLSVEAVTDRVQPLLTLLEEAGKGLSVTGSSARVPVIVITGARATGTSTVGFSRAREGWAAGVRTGFADLDQLAFLRPDPHPALGAANLAALHEVFGRRGAERFVVSAHLVGTRAHQLIHDVAADVTIIRLRADRETMAAHIAARHGGSQARLAGDDLVGASSAYQAEVLEQALAQQDLLDAQADEDQLIVVGPPGPGAR